VAGAALCTREDAAGAQALYDQAKKGHQQGLVSELQLLYNESTLVGVQACAGLIPHSRYCTDKAVILRQILKLNQDLASSGASSAGSVMSSYEQLAALGRECLEL
jgi:hypothetical protein